MDNLSEISLLTILLATSIALSLVCLFLVQKYGTWLSLSDGGIFGTIFANTMPTLVGFIFAFVTVAAWQNHNAVSDNVSKEAHTLFDLYQMLEAYPSEAKKAGQEEIINYTQAVINQEWPNLTSQKMDVETFKKLEHINTTFHNHQAANLEGLAVHTETLRLFSTYRDLRRNRIENAVSFVGRPMWGALVLSALFLTLFSAFFKTKNIRIHAVMMALEGGSLGVMFFLLVLFDNPFAGPSAIQPTSFQKTLDSIAILQKH
jgi:presenilin-like A22 family membrane protease